MAINKRKVLDAARKLAHKGSKQKALNEYNKLVQADPRDAKLLLEIGDVYRRWGQGEEAIAQYTKVANQFKQDGFDARAVAVLKQILNLDPKRYTAQVMLADLYQRMGLDSEAVGALQTAADGYYREGRRHEALELLRKMASLDPSNTTSRLKVAELLQQEGMEDDAVIEYEEVVEELGRQGANEQICSVQERILELRPDHVSTLTALARNLNDLGRPERAEPYAVRALDQTQEPENFELLAGIYKSLGSDAKLAAVTRDLAAYFKGRGDDDRARDVLQRLPPEAALDGSDFGTDQSEIEGPDLADDDLLDDEDFLVTDTTDQSEVQPLLEADESGARPVLEGPSDADLPEGDPEQLLAEASVYLRYGKLEQAIASLRSALLQEPEHRGVLEKLGEAYAEAGQNDDAVGCFARAVAQARSEGDFEAFDVLRDRLAALDPEAASQIEPMLRAESEVGPEAADEGLDFGLDATIGGGSSSEPTEDESREIDFDVELDVVTDDDTVQAAAEGTLVDDADSDAIEFDLDSETAFIEADPADEQDEETSLHEDADTGIEVEVEVDLDEAESAGVEVPDESLDEEIEIDFDEAVSGLATEVDEVSSASESASSQFGQSTTTAEQIGEDLEEAEFYLQQGLEDEAEAIYRRILEAAPNHPSAQLKLGELAARRGEDPSAVTDVGVGSSEPITTGVSDADSFDIDLDGDADRDENAGGNTIEVVLDADEPEPDVEVSFDDAFTDDQETSVCLDDDSVSDALKEPESKASPELSDDLAAILAEAEAAVDAVEEPGIEPGVVDLDAAAPADEDTERHVAVEHGERSNMGDLLGEDATEVESFGEPETALAEPSFAIEPVQADPGPIRVEAEDTVPLADAARLAVALTSAKNSRVVGGACEATFDLGAELADVLGQDDEENEEPEASCRSTVEDGFESLFSDFKKGVSATIDEGDFDTRFDLGIAYREMGLFDDAISEFTACLGSPVRKLESLHMMALCAIDLGRHGDAVNHLEQALSGDRVENNNVAALQFDLGRAQRIAGNRGAARSAFEVVRQLDGKFPGLEAEIQALDDLDAEPESSLELENSNEDFESFADIMDDDEMPHPEPETFESFDDVITEAEAEGVAIAVQAEPAVESDPGTTSDPATSRSGRKKRRKISFV